MTDAEEREWNRRALNVPGRQASATQVNASDTPARQVQCIECKCAVTLSGFAWDVAKSASEMLLARREQPLRNDEMTRCAPCGKEWGARRRELYIELCTKVNTAQGDANANGRVDVQLVGYLRMYGHGTLADGIESGAKLWAEKNEKRSRGRTTRGEK